VSDRLLSDHLSLSERVYIRIREMILNMELPPGSRLKDFELANRLGVSNTPLREAIRRLAAESLVETLPRRGTFVKKLSIEEVERLYEIRTALEVLATRLASQRASEETLEEVLRASDQHIKAVQRGNLQEYLALDRRFHELIAEGANNPILVSMLSSLADRIHIVRRLTSDLAQDVITGHEHKAIAETLARRDGDTAAARMEEHLRKHCGRVLEFLRAEEGA
jgi:DNA-binding GntR family transcriptional regulator